MPDPNTPDPITPDPNTPDPLKEAWQMQTAQPQFTIDPNLLLTEFRRNERTFTAMIFHRDVREIGVALILIPVWIVLGRCSDSPWTWYLTIPGLLWIAGFMLVDRRRHARPPAPEAPMLQQVAAALADVEHQITLLKNVLWWYLLPLALPMFAFFAHVSWRSWDGSWLSLVMSAIPFTIVVGVFAFVYWLNQYAVRKTLEPRREELQTLLETLQESP